MDTPLADVTTPEVARALGVSLPAAHQALDELGVPRTGRGTVRRVDANTAAQLIARRGSTPRSSRTSSELRVLAALSFSPLGLTSFRAIAEKAGLSPTTTSRLTPRLAEERYVEQREVKTASGRAHRGIRWFANSRVWPADVREAVRATRLPRRQVKQTAALPPELHHLFWNADVATLDPLASGSYLAGRLLDAPDLRAWQWALSNLPREAVETAVGRRGVSAQTRALVRNWWRDES